MNSFETYIQELNQISKDYQTGNFNYEMSLSEYKERIGYIRPEHPFYKKKVIVKDGNTPDLI